MNIVQTPPRFYPRTGGIETACFYLSKELVKMGHRVKVICANEPAVEDFIIGGIEVYRLPYIGKISNTNITFTLAEELLKDDFDIIHTHLPHPWSADISALISFIKNKPLFLTYYNDIMGHGLNKIIADSYNHSALKFLLKKAVKIFISHQGYLQSSLFLRLFADKVIVAPLGVDLDKFKPLNIAKEDNYNSIFFLSRLDRFHQYKGLEYLLSAFRKAADRLPLKLYVGGGGELSDYYKKLVILQKLKEKVIFLGDLSDEDLLKYYNLCDVFVLPSISSAQEGFGLVALEALACGKPLVVTDIVGVAQDIVAYQAGIVVRPRRIDELSQALAGLFLNKAHREAMGKNAYRLAKEKYSWASHAGIIQNEYLRYG